MRKKDIVILGLALFAMFFGAGNLIFPPAIGNMAGNEWFLAMLGFYITGIGMPILGIVGVIKAGGSIIDFGKHVGEKFAIGFGLVIVLILGPFMGVPRTGATTFEMGIAPLFPQVPMAVVVGIFFVLTWLLAVKQNSIIDIIGKWLTPVLVTLLLFIVGVGIFNPIGEPMTHNFSAFKDGFLGGYQTMDVFVAIMLGAIILKALKSKGYGKDEYFEMTLKAGLIAAFGLAVIYGGLLYLGATGQSLLADVSTRSMMTVTIVNSILGNMGSVLLGISVSFACLTTSIGITAAASEFVDQITPKEIKYNFIVTLSVVVSAFMAMGGVDFIVGAAGPILAIIYPLSIVLVALNICTDYVVYKKCFKWTIVATSLVSIPMGMSELGIGRALIDPMVDALPMARFGLPWLVPAILGFVISYLAFEYKNKGSRKRVAPHLR